MFSHLLPVVLDTTQDFIEAMVPAALEGKLSLDGVDTLCANYRRRAICCLLLTLDKEEFAVALEKSGQALRHFLATATEEGKATSKGIGFFDALAVEDWDCATAIAEEARSTYNPDLELEEDFLYVTFLMKLVLLGAKDAELDRILSRWEKLLDGESDARHSLCEALLKPGPKAFDTALRTLLSQTKEHYAQHGQDLEMEETATEGALSVEGLALLRIATRRGLPVKAKYALIPAAAIKATRQQLPADAWMDPS